MSLDIGRIAAPASLLPVLDRLKDLRVWVVGDVMLDEYVAGAVNRISPEAPVAVVRVQDTEFRLGGAANVARQIAALGARVSLAGVTGADAAGETLERLCRESGIATHGLMRVPGRSTTRKLRVLGHNQQLLRLDWEDTGDCATPAIHDMIAALDDGQDPDVVIISDYAKGVVTATTIDAIAAVRERTGVPVLVDPKHRDFSRYRGATAITPNLRELEAAAGTGLNPDDRGAVAAAARQLMAGSRLFAMVVTLGDRGMLVVPADGPEVPIPAVQRTVFDVTGAGDTAIALLAAVLGARAPLVAAAQIANVAAGIAVGQVGTVAVDTDSIRAALTDAPAGKIVAASELAARAASWRLAGKRIVFTNGCFDLLHGGHLALLREAAKLGDFLVLAINSDESIRRLKGADRPVVLEGDRAALLAALSCVDAVTIFDEDTPLVAIQRVRPQVLVKGADYKIESVIGREFVESIGGRVVLVPLLPERSTTSLVKRIRGVG